MKGKGRYDRLRSETRKMYKDQRSVCERALQRLDTMETYETYSQDISDGTGPEGLYTHILPDRTETIDKAVLQAVHIAHGTAAGIQDPQRLTNYRFYINTPYYDRASVDNFPLYALDDERVSAIVELVRETLAHYREDRLDQEGHDQERPDSLLNIIVRIYRPGDILNFHTDRPDFGEHIYGLVLQNHRPDYGLLLTDHKRSHYMLRECPGFTWHLSGQARWDYEHGYCADTLCDEEYVRISVTCRYFNEARLIPD